MQWGFCKQACIRIRYQTLLKFHTLQLKISQILYMNLHPTNNMVENWIENKSLLEREYILKLVNKHIMGINVQIFGIYSFVMRIFITKLIQEYAFKYMVKILTLQPKISQVLYINPYSTNDMIGRLERECIFPLIKRIHQELLEDLQLYKGKKCILSLIIFILCPIFYSLSNFSIVSLGREYIFPVI